MNKRPLGRTGLHIAPLVFGGNVLGWTADEKTSFALLDAFVDAGFDAIDTADSYSRWHEGHVGGESETIIGRWLAANPGKRSKVTLFTKVGSDMGAPDKKGLSRGWIERAAEDSLRRLQTDVIDLYQSHWPDPQTPHAESLEAYGKLIAAGKVRAVGCSNFDAALLADALKAADAGGLQRYQTLQPLYNLYDRSGFEGTLRDLVVAENIGVIPYYGLAAGFLTGKYRSKADLDKSPRGKRVAERYLDDRGLKILAALDTVAARQNTTPAAVALAWLVRRPGVTAPIASATSLAQLGSLIRFVDLALGADDIALLDAAGA